VFGTDYPFAARNLVEHVNGLKECGVFSASDLQAIDQNALKFLSRIARI